MRITIRIPKKAKCFLLEDTQERIDWFKSKLPFLDTADNVKDAIAYLSTQKYDFVFLDHDLGLLDYAGYSAGQPGNGKDVARYLSGRNFMGDNVVIHSWNPVGAAAMKDILENASAIPFGQFEIDLGD
jgi:hypothetical protein